MKLILRQLVPFLLFTGLAWLFVRIGMAVFFPA
jgi:hypothetical protein